MTGRKGWRTTVTQMLLLIWDNRRRRWRRKIRRTATGRRRDIGLDRRHVTHIVTCFWGRISIGIMRPWLMHVVLRVIWGDGSVGCWMRRRWSRVCELGRRRCSRSSWRRRKFSGVRIVTTWRRRRVFTVMWIVGAAAGVGWRRGVVLVSVAVVVIVILCRRLILIF